MATTRKTRKTKTTRKRSGCASRRKKTRVGTLSVTKRKRRKTRKS